MTSQRGEPASPGMVGEATISSLQASRFWAAASDDEESEEQVSSEESEEESSDGSSSGSGDSDDSDASGSDSDSDDSDDSDDRRRGASRCADKGGGLREVPQNGGTHSVRSACGLRRAPLELQDNMAPWTPCAERTAPGPFARVIYDATIGCPRCD